MNKKNILHVVTVSFSIPIFFRGQFKYFLDTQNTYLASSESNDMFKKSFEYGFTPIFINISRTISPFRDLLVIVQLCKAIKKYQIDVVVGHTPKAALLTMIAGVIMRIKNRVYFKHGLVYETQFGLLKKILIFIDYLTDFLATKIICVSESVLRKSLEIPFCRKSKYFIPAKGTCNGIDSMNKFNPDLIDSNEITVLKNHLGISSETIVIGFIGRLAKDKGVKELVSSLKYLDTLNSNLRLLLVGPVDERDPIINLELDLITDIIRVDFVENTELYYSLMDIFILPSYREGFPTVNLEAASMRLPVVTTKSTGCIDSIVENETGIYTDIDGQSIANALNFYLKNPSIRIEHGKNGRKHVLKNYNQENVWNAISNIYFNS